MKRIWSSPIQRVVVIILIFTFQIHSLGRIHCYPLTIGHALVCTWTNLLSTYATSSIFQQGWVGWHSNHTLDHQKFQLTEHKQRGSSIQDETQLFWLPIFSKKSIGKCSCVSFLYHLLDFLLQQGVIRPSTLVNLSLV